MPGNFLMEYIWTWWGVPKVRKAYKQRGKVVVEVMRISSVSKCAKAAVARLSFSLLPPPLFSITLTERASCRPEPTYYHISNIHDKHFTSETSSDSFHNKFVTLKVPARHTVSEQRTTSSSSIIVVIQIIIMLENMALGQKITCTCGAMPC